MDYLRALQVPFHLTSMTMVGTFSVVIAFFLWLATFLGLAGAIWAFVIVLFLNIWVLKYCYQMIEAIADGAQEPPVMDTEMLSPFESRPMSQLALAVAGGTLCWKIGGGAGVALAVVLLLAFPAQVALLAMGDNVFQAANPLKWFRVIRGLGPWYLLILGVLGAGALVALLRSRISLWLLVEVAIALTCEIAFFGLIGSCIWIRRRQLGFEPSRSPERTEARLESERVKQRAKMLDEVFEQARIGKHVDATAPLARWLRDLDAEFAVRDSLHVAEQALKWQVLPALNPIGSTLIRHLLRFGRPDAALSIYQRFRERSTHFTMDSAPDLRTLAEYAESLGKQELAQSMRLETPVHHPPT